MGTLETMKDIFNNPNKIIEEWKKDGKKVVGHSPGRDNPCCRHVTLPYLWYPRTY
ncbi:MAG: hypothetical protein FD151_731 [bacterium]|nr:MAG: hypothetical protein FD151_731 [bacterium]